MFNQKLFGLNLSTWLIIGMIVIFMSDNKQNNIKNFLPMNLDKMGNNDNNLLLLGAVAMIVIFSLCKCSMENFSSCNTVEDSKASSDGNSNGHSNGNSSNGHYDDIIKVYNFNTSWCGYSKNFQPIWDEFMNKHHGKNNVIVKDVKCDDESNAHSQKLCKTYEVPGYPTIIFEHNNNKIDYMGPRTVEGLEQKLMQLRQ